MILRRKSRKLVVFAGILFMVAVVAQKMIGIEYRKLTVSYYPMRERRRESSVNTQVIPNRLIKANQGASIDKKISKSKNTRTIETRKSNTQVPSKN